jgi:tetratricopeptide (TPR) repeat protein
LLFDVLCVPACLADSNAPLGLGKNHWPRITLAELNRSTEFARAVHQGPHWALKHDDHFDDYFQFASEYDTVGTAEGNRRYEYKAWTPQEIKTLKDIFDQIIETMPGLVRKAASGSRLKLYRAATLPYISKSMQKWDAAAVTGPNAIVFGDGFFPKEWHEQMRASVHELVHAADYGCRLSDSQEWVNFANPIISQEKCKIYVLSDISNERWAELTKKRWRYAENLKEALAEYISGQALLDYPGPAKGRFRNWLISADKTDVEFLRHYKRGLVLLDSENFDAAIEEFLEASKIDPSCPTPYAFITACYGRQRKFAEAIAASDSALTHFENAGVPSAEPEFLHMLQHRSRSLLEIGQYDKAFTTLEQALEHNPRDTYCLQLISDCYEHKKDYAMTAYDLYLNQIDGFRAIDGVLASGADPAYIVKCLDESVLASNNGFWPRYRRAKYLEYLADREADEAARKKLYEHSLADFIKSMQSRNCPTAWALTSCSQVNLKLGHTEAAQRLYEKARCLVPDSPWVAIMQLRLTQASGDEMASYLQYELFRSKFLKNPPPFPQINPDIKDVLKPLACAAAEIQNRLKKLDRVLFPSK